MKIQVDLDATVWADFKSKVEAQGKTLKEVVPTVIEPVLRAYVRFQSDGVVPTVPTPFAHQAVLLNAPVPSVKRCELCDMPTERLFHKGELKVCYKCWRDSIISVAVT